jgi:hypothetical protein
MTRIQQLVAGGLPTLAASALLVANAGPALAHHTVVYQGKDMASVSADHARASVCDREKDATPSTRSSGQLSICQRVGRRRPGL